MNRDLLRGHLVKYNHAQLQFFQPQSRFVSDPQQLAQVVKVVMPNKNLKAPYQQDLLQISEAQLNASLLCWLFQLGTAWVWINHLGIKQALLKRVFFKVFQMIQWTRLFAVKIESPQFFFGKTHGQNPGFLNISTTA